MNIGIHKSLRGLDNYQFLDRYICTNKGDVYRVKLINNKPFYKRMSPFRTRDGYIEFVLTDINGIKKHIQGHRIVASLFVPNDDVINKKYVNHKDGNRSNNYYRNLEWVTQGDNLRHSYDKLGRKPWNKKNGFYYFN